MSDDMLNLMALRYGSASGVITLENFIGLILRFECMNREYIYTGACGYVVFRITKLNLPLC